MKRHFSKTPLSIFVVVFIIPVLTAVAYAQSSRPGTEPVGAVAGTFTPSCGSSSQSESLPSYGWPIKPFNEQHPIRGNLNDPRFGGGGKSIDDTEANQENFHFGVDIAGPDGTPVYAVEDGEVYVLNTNAGHLAVVSSNREVGYWHVKPIIVSHKQKVFQGQQIGFIESSWGHVHLAEKSGRKYLNPLRPGALTPYNDFGAPVIAGFFISNGENQVSSGEVRGKVSLAANIYDLPPTKPSSPWDDIKVTPARISWSIKSLSGEQVLGDTTAVDFGKNLCEGIELAKIYAPGTSQNTAEQTGNYNFWLIRDWDTTQIRNGEYTVTIKAEDYKNNVTRKEFQIEIKNGAGGDRAPVPTPTPISFLTQVPIPEIKPNEKKVPSAEPPMPALSAPAPSAPVEHPPVTSQEEAAAITPQLTKKGEAQDEKQLLSIAPLIANFYQWALGIGGLVALGVLIFGGILYTVSAGNASREEDAKQWITGAFVGLIILFGSWFILNTINPELTKLTDLRLLANKAAESAGGDSSPYPVINGQTCPLPADGFSWGGGCGGSRPGIPGGHQGVDLMALLGTPLYAIEDGVIDGGWGWNYYGGWRFWLYADSGSKYYYAHTLSKDNLPLQGKRFKAGERIGYVGESGNGSEGTTGNVGGPHLHLQWVPSQGGPVCGTPPNVDPVPLIRTVCTNG